jgi:hypothetical protein
VQSPVRVLVSAGGQVLRVATGIAASLRPAAKPLHPEGVVTSAVLRRFGADEAIGSAWLDEPGTDGVLVRQSRAVGVPSGLPDVFGLALRVPTPGGGHGDLLLASTGLGRLTRFTLTASRSPRKRPLTTLLPYRTPSGPVLISAVHRDEQTIDLSWALGSGPWHPFAELQVDHQEARTGDAPVSFDPLRNTLPGLENYEWVRRLREPSYSTARRSRLG